MINFANNSLFIVKILCIVIGILLFVYGLLSNKKDKNRLRIKRCSVKTTAKVSGFDKNEKVVVKKSYREYSQYNTYNKKVTYTYHTPYITFEDENNETYDIKYSYPIKMKLKTGQNIDIRYNPENPYDFYICGDKKVQIFSSQAMMIGLILFAAG